MTVEQSPRLAVIPETIAVTGASLARALAQKGPPNMTIDEPEAFDPSDPLLQEVLADTAAAGAEAEKLRGDAILKKEELFPIIEEGEVPRRLVCYFASGAPIDQSDVAPFGSMLDSVGDCDRLDLVLNSGGGYGEVAEKLVEMAHSRCRKEFRVVVPSFAKSAATMIALGSHSIVMAADRSELGPIDPQYEMSIAGEIQSVSGTSFVAAYKRLQEDIRETAAKGEPVVGLLQALSHSSMEPAFIEHCERGLEFSRDVARKFLTEYHLPAKHRLTGETPTDDQIALQVEQAAQNLISEDSRFSHGRLIGPLEARDEVGLNIEIMDHDDPVWRAYWALFVRSEIYMQSLMGPDRPRASKLFVTRRATLPTYY